MFLGAGGEFAAFDIDEKFALMGGDDEVETFEGVIDVEGAFGFVDGDVGDTKRAEIGFKGGFVMIIALGHEKKPAAGRN